MSQPDELPSPKLAAAAEVQDFRHEAALADALLHPQDRASGCGRRLRRHIRREQERDKRRGGGEPASAAAAGAASRGGSMGRRERSVYRAFNALPGNCGSAAELWDAADEWRIGPWSNEDRQGH